MVFDVEVQLTPRYVLLRCSGKYDLASILDVYAQAFVIAERENLPAAIVDGRALESDPPATMDRLEMGLFVANHRPPGVRLAVVGETGMVDPGRFGETVARNRGADARVFTDFELAELWVEMGLTTSQGDLES